MNDLGTAEGLGGQATISRTLREERIPRLPMGRCVRFEWAFPTARAMARETPQRLTE
jgi:hypothetical protein